MFRRSSLGVPVNILLRYIEIMTYQPRDLPHRNGYIYDLLDSFCKFAEKSLSKIKSENKEHHWDIALYLTGLDLYTDRDYKYKGKIFYSFNNHNSFYVNGETKMNDSCTSQPSCAIVEFDAVNKFTQEVLPTTGFGVPPVKLALSKLLVI